MIKVEVINEDFTLEKFNELKNITRKSVAEKGKLFKGDTFECDEKMVDYLTGNNPLNKVVVKVIEVEPEIKILSQSPIEELEKAVSVKTEITTTKPKKKKSSKE